VDARRARLACAAHEASTDPTASIRTAVETLAGQLAELVRRRVADTRLDRLRIRALDLAQRATT
jgi:hypothetical protein